MNEESINKGKINRIKIDQKKLSDLSADMDQILEYAENKLVEDKNVTLSMNSMSGDFDKWKESKAIERNNLINKAKITTNEVKKVIDTALFTTISKINESGEELTAEKINEIKGTKIFEFTNHALEITNKKLIKDFDKDVIRVYKLRKHENLYDAILKQTNKGIENGVKIVYRNGRHVSFKSYMEMNVRTTVRQEANDYLFKASKNNRVVFYLCNYFADSADDHKDFQGKYYYDKNWKSFKFSKETEDKIQAMINRYHMRSYQQVVDGPPYLTTRPNCRHTLTPIPLDQALKNNPAETGEKYGLRKGTYKSKNYKDLQTQRLNERNIRKYKARLENDIAMAKHMHSPQLSAQINRDKYLIKYWQSRQRLLVAQNPALKRDYRREDNKAIVQDLGVKYHNK